YLALLLLFFGRVALGLLALVAVAFVSPMTVSGPAALGLVKLDWHLVSHASKGLTVLMIAIAAVVVGLLLSELFGLSYAAFIKSTAAIVCILLTPVILQLYSFPFGSKFDSYAQIIRAPWLPTEMITLTSGREFTGYVLSGDGNWLVVLKEASR